MEELTFTDLKPGKRYKGSGMVTADGDFQFRKYKERSAETEDETDERLIAQDEYCQVWQYQKKFTIKLDIPTKKLTPMVVFSLINKQVKFLNKILFNRKS